MPRILTYTAVNPGDQASIALNEIDPIRVVTLAEPLCTRGRVSVAS